jgi:hypothetical protein
LSLNARCAEEVPARMAGGFVSFVEKILAAPVAPLANVDGL